MTITAARRLGDWGHLRDEWRDIEILELDVLGVPVRLLYVAGSGHGTPHLLVHGLGGAASNWIESLLPLASTGPVVAVDLPGFGHTPTPADGSARIRANVKFIPALLDALDWDRVVLHGNSMGGLIATLVAARWPERVASLVLVDPALPPTLRQRWQLPGAAALYVAPLLLPGATAAVRYGLGQLATHADSLDADIMLKITLADVHSLRSDVLALMAEDMAAADGASLAKGLVDAGRSLADLYVEGREIEAAVDAITAPTLLVWGDADRLVGRASIDAVMARRPDWTLAVFDGVGHTPMLETPTVYVGAVLAHLGAGATVRA